MKIKIIIPVYISHELHLDFTRQTLESIQTKHDHEVILINNYCAPEFKSQLDSLITYPLSLIPNPSGNILASAWNLGIKHTFPAAHYCLIINNDIVFHPKCIDNLVTFATTHPQFLLWSASQWSNLRTLSKAKMTHSWSPHPHFSCFMVNHRVIDVVGYFDEHFTFGYFEDNDYHTRILIKKGTAAATNSAKFYHYGSRTVNVDDNLAADAKFHYQQNRKYFEKKWGLDIHGRAFDPPEEILKQIRPSLALPKL